MPGGGLGMGITALYAALDDVVKRHSLDGLAIAVVDPDFGCQVFASGPDFANAVAEFAPPRDGGWCTQPPLEWMPPEIDILQALALTALKLGAVDPDADPQAGLEVALRRIAGVRAVLYEGTVMQVVIEPGARHDVVSEIAAVPAGARTVVIVEATATGDSHESVTVPAERVELVAVRSQPETGELEVHLCVGDRRTVGRGPLQGAATAAAVATLDALTELDEPHDCRVAWARIVETLPDGLVLVGVSLSRTGGGTVYGLAPGASPIEAAARATLDACARAIDHA